MRSPTLRTPGFRAHTLRVLAGATALFCVMPPVQAADAEPRIVVLKEDFQPFHEATAGFSAAMAGAGFRPRLREVILDRKQPKRAVEQVREHKPQVVVSIGTTATLFSKREFPELPIVFAMVVNPKKSGIIDNAYGDNVTGAAIDIPYALQFRKFKEVVPRVRRLGVLSNPQRTGNLVAEAQEAAESVGLDLIVEPVHAPEQVPAALERLLDKGIDGLWTVPDPTVFPGSTEVLIKESARAGLPTMGLSAQFCKAGFLFALTVDFDDNGRQAGELTSQVLHGAQPRELRVVMPQDVGLVLNQRIAEYIGHTFPPGVLESATTVYN